MTHVEDSARALLWDHGVGMHALDVPDSLEESTDWDLGLVAEVSDRIIGMARLTELDSDLIVLDQLAVHPSWSRQGVGRALLLATADLCRGHGYTAITGTTFRDVVFNAPFYAALGSGGGHRPAVRRWPAGATENLAFPQVYGWGPRRRSPGAGESVPRVVSSWGLDEG